MDDVAREAQIKGYDDGFRGVHKPESVRGTKFTGHLLDSYNHGHRQGKSDRERDAAKLRQSDGP